LIDGAIEGVERNTLELLGIEPLQCWEEMLPERAAAPDHVLPEPRLALVHAGRDAGAKRRAVERSGNALLVHSVAGFVHGREQRVAEIVLAHARGDTRVARTKPRAKRMMRLVKPAAVEVVAKPRHDIEAEAKLWRFSEGAAQATIVG